jgi:hypothetical protein
VTWRKPSWPQVRGGILFFCGLAGVAYETFIKRPPDYGMLPIFGAMMGLPFFDKRDGDDSDPPAVRALNDSSRSGK